VEPGRRRTAFGWVRASLLAMACASVPANAAAARATVTVGEVTAKVSGADARTERMLRSLVARELDRMELDRAPRTETYVLSASLVRLDVRASRDGSHATCTVSATLRNARSGALLAIMRGSGVAEDDEGELESAKQRALSAAVHGAVKRVPEAL
jgi:hypothetical protein